MSAAQPTSTPKPLSSYNWSVNAKPNLAENPPPESSAETVLDHFDTYARRLCWFRFVDLRHTGNLSLVFSAAGDGARGGCGTEQVLDLTAKGFELYSVGYSAPYGAGDANQDLQDLTGQGDYAIVVEVPFTQYQGAMHCVAEQIVIIGWTAGRYADITGRSKPYLRKRLESMRANLPADTDPTYVCQKAEIAQLQRFFGDRNAGLSDAVEWTTWSDRRDREFGIDILGDIGTPEAAQYLNKLAADPDKYIADYARETLGDIQNHPNRTDEVTIDQEDLKSPDGL